MFKSEVKYVLKTVIHGFVDTVGYETLQGFSTDISKAYKFPTVEDAQAYRNGYAKGRGYTLAKTFMLITPIEERSAITIQGYADEILSEDYNDDGYSSEEFTLGRARLGMQLEANGLDISQLDTVIKEAMITALAMLSYERDKGALDFAYGDWKGYLTFEPLCSDYVEPEKPVSAVKPDVDAKSPLSNWSVYSEANETFYASGGYWLKTPTFYSEKIAKHLATVNKSQGAEALGPEDTAIVMNARTSSQGWMNQPDTKACNPVRWSASNS